MSTVYLLRHDAAALNKTEAALSGSAWRVAGRGETLHGALAEIALQMPDVVATDLRLVDADAMQVARALGRLDVRPQLLLLTPTADDLQLFAALSTGANAYHVEAGPGLGLVAALDALHERRALISPQLARQALAAFGIERSPLVTARQAPSAQDASPAGRQIDQAGRHLLSLLAHGLLVNEVAALWRLAAAEIEARIWRLVRLLHVRSRELLLA
jgi:DNA-binding NarL/FixJ family response regulator